MLIYCTTNLIDGKKYVGQTTRSLEQRFKEHCNNPNSEIGQAIAKYGIENFKTEILEECDTIKFLNVAEQYWIYKLNCKIPNGYNVREGGFGSDKAERNNNENVQELKNKNSDLTKELERCHLELRIVKLERDVEIIERKISIESLKERLSKLEAAQENLAAQFAKFAG